MSLWWQTGRDQPVVEQAASVTSDAVDNQYTGKYNAAPQVMKSQCSSEHLRMITSRSILEI